MSISMEMRLAAISQSIHFRCCYKGWSPAAAFGGEQVAHAAYQDGRSAAYAIVVGMDKAAELEAFGS